MPLTHDPTFGNPTAVALRAELAGGRFGAVRECLAATQEPNLRQFYVASLHEWAGRPNVLDHWKRSEPNEAAGWLVSGAHATCWAWDARGGGRADTVTEDMAERFCERLQQASDDLTRAAELDPADPLPHAYQVLVCLGLNLPEAMARKHFDAAVSRYPEHHAAHCFLLSYLCEKWHGSHEAMFDHARRCSGRAPAGSLVHVLIAQAHAERWLYAVHFADEPGGDDYYRRTDVREDVFAAYDRSLGSSRHQEGPLTRVVANDWAYALARCGDWLAARREFERVGDIPTSVPWGFHDEPLVALRRFRDLVQRDPAAHPVPPPVRSAPTPDEKPWWKFW